MKTAITTTGLLKKALALPRQLDWPQDSGVSHLERASKNLLSLCSGCLSPQRTIALFFKLLEIGEHNTHGGDRKKFWEDYLYDGLILQTWLILGPQAAVVAHERLGMTAKQFAILEKNKRVEDFHAVLLMRFGIFTVAEWSHQGKCRFWLQNNPHCPCFFRQVYHRNDLIEYADLVQQHYFSAKGLWQKDAALWIERHML